MDIFHIAFLQNLATESPRKKGDKGNTGAAREWLSINVRHRRKIAGEAGGRERGKGGDKTPAKKISRARRSRLITANRKGIIKIRMARFVIRENALEEYGGGERDGFFFLFVVENRFRFSFATAAASESI